MATTKTTKTDTRPRALPWALWNEELERTIAERTTPEQVEAVYQAYLRGEYAHTPRVVNRTPTYRDHNSESYTVGCGGDRNHQAFAPRSSNPISDKQKSFIRSLATERDLTKLVPGLDGTSIDTYTTVQASALIKRLLELPKLQAAAPVAKAAPEPAPASARTRLDFSAIPDGNYAICVDGVVKFYRVSTSKRGFKNVQVRASDQLFMQFGKAGIAILHRIVEAGLEASQMLFATELGCCWRCGRTLTDEESRARGMGPDCASK